MTSTEATYDALNNKIERRCIETVNLTEIPIELDSSAPCGFLWFLVMPTHVVNFCRNLCFGYDTQSKTALHVTIGDKDLKFL